MTVVLPYRDAAPTLDEAIQSVCDQRGAAIEVVLVDDGSTDGGSEIARRHAKRDPRLRLVATGGVGLPGALARGLEEARTDLVARMDADDIAMPDRIHLQVRAMAKAPRVAALGTLVEGFSDGGQLGLGMKAYIAWLNELVTPEEHARDLFVESPLCHPSVMLRRSAVLAVGGYRDMPWAEDYDLWLRLDAAGYELAKVPAMLLQWRHHGKRATFRDPRYASERFVEAKATFLAPRLLARAPRPIAVWGAGKIARRFARALEGHGVPIAGFWDIDPRKVGRTARGTKILGPADLPEAAAARSRPYFVAAVGTRGARAIVRARFASHGFVEADDFVCVA